MTVLIHPPPFEISYHGKSGKGVGGSPRRHCCPGRCRALVWLAGVCGLNLSVTPDGVPPPLKKGRHWQRGFVSNNSTEEHQNFTEAPKPPLRRGGGIERSEDDGEVVPRSTQIKHKKPLHSCPTCGIIPLAVSGRHQIEDLPL